MLNFGIFLAPFAIFPLIYCFLKNFLVEVKFELQVIQIIEQNEWKNDIHVTESSVRPYLGNEKKFETSCSGNTTTNVCPSDF